MCVRETNRFEGHTGEEAIDHHMIVVRQHGGAELQQELLGAQTVDQDVKPMLKYSRTEIHNSVNFVRHF